MTTFERPAGRIKAVYGRTKGLVARRKALMVKGNINNNIIEINSSSESDNEDEDNEKENENEIPKKSSSSDSQKIQKLASIVPISSFTVINSSESEDEVVKPSRWRNDQRARVRKEKCRPVLKDEDESEDESERERERDRDGKKGEEEQDVEELLNLLGKNLLVGEKPSESAAEKVNPVEDKTSCQALLALCEQDKPSNFSEFLYQLEDNTDCSAWQKYGEASYSEVYGLFGSDFVVKIIPLLDEHVIASEISLPDRSLASDVHREVEMTQALANVSEGFVKMYSAQVVQGTYPNRLLQARAARRKSKPEETSSTSPESFSSSQKYAALVLRNGGQDLESYEDLSWKQAASILCQVVNTLSQGEETHQFEHRDLHWGNVVIAPVEDFIEEKESPLIKGKHIEQFQNEAYSGVKATIIDYTLSRATIGKTLIAYDFEDQSLFEGRGDIDMQFDVYRQMKQETNTTWSAFYPHTNVLWLNYLASKLIDEKHIPNPKRRSRLDLRGSEELQCRNFLMEVKQLLLSKRIESAVDLKSQLTTIDL